MRILVAHNRYRSAAPSGENQLVDAEIALLRDGGVDVVPMVTDSDDLSGPLGVLRGAPGPVYSPSGVRRFIRLLRETRPDVVHVHNVYPLISPYVVRVAARAGVPVVQTVHNYRHGCVNGLHLRDGHPCTDCLGTRSGWPAVQHGCYRGSRLQTLPMTVGQNLHRRTWRDGVARFLALTPFTADMLVRAGAPRERITIRPTWVPDPGAAGPPGADLLYVGRLDEPKGVDLLLEAWKLGGRASGRRLLIAGDGPLADVVHEAALRDPTIRPLGMLDPTQVRDAMSASAYVVVPSRVFDGYPLVVAEAFGVGRAVLTVSGGSVETIVGDDGGWTVDRTPDALATAIRTIDDDEVRRAGVAARSRYERDNTPEQGLRSLIEAYSDVTA